MNPPRRRLCASLLAALLAIALAGCSSEGTDPPPPVSACAADRTVSDGDALQQALDSAEAGDVIGLSDGDYEGTFTITTAGTSSRPITLCGSGRARLVGPSVEAGYTLHLDGASYWRLEGFSVRGGQKGVMLDGASHNELSGLSISEVGDEALHLRTGSSHNLVTGLTIRRTGLREPEFGEGIYVGSAQSNWCDLTGCEPDHSDANRIIDNDVRQTTAEAVDIKEGTKGGELSDNVLRGGSGAADSVVDLKGNGWRVAGNQIATTGADAVQVHVILEGWGSGNRVVGNSFRLSGPGYAVHLVGAAEQSDNVVGCDQPITPPDAGELSNAGCE